MLESGTGSALLEYELSNRCACGTATQGAGEAGLELRSMALNCGEENVGDILMRGDYHRFSNRVVIRTGTKDYPSVILRGHFKENHFPDNCPHICCFIKHIYLSSCLR